MRGWQPNGKLNVDCAGVIAAFGFDLAGNREQCQHKIPLVLKLVPMVGDALVGELIVFSLVLQHIGTKWLYIGFKKPSGEWFAVTRFDEFISVVD